MSILSEIERISGAKLAISGAIVYKGGTVTEGSLIDTYAAAISGIPAGGEDVTLGVVDSNGAFQPLSFSGTTATASGAAITVSGGYKTWDSPLSAPYTPLGSLTYTPTTAAQVISAGQYLTGNQTIIGDAALVGSNIKSGTSIFGVSGTFTGGGSSTDFSVVTAEPGEVASGEMFYDSTGALVSGTMDSAYLETHIVTEDGIPWTVVNEVYFGGFISAGIYTTEFTPTAQTAPTAAVSINAATGVVTASAIYSSGWQANESSATTSAQLNTYAGGTITPTSSSQTIASQQYLTGAVVVQGDVNLVASNIKSGTSIFGVSGSFAGGAAADVYSCASVNTGSQVWTGYKAVLNQSTHIYEYETTPTSNLTYSGVSLPMVGETYMDGAMLKAVVYEGLPIGGLLCYAKPSSTWSAGQSVATWGDFSSASNLGSSPQIATISGVTGIKARYGDALRCWSKAPSADFTFLAKFYIGDTSASKLNLLKFNTQYGAIMCFEEIGGDNIFLLSKQGTDYTGVPVNMSTLGIGSHTAAITFVKSTGATKFYFDGVLYDTTTYFPDGDFEYSGEFIYDQSDTTDNLVLGLAAYNRALIASEISGVVW